MDNHKFGDVSYSLENTNSYDTAYTETSEGDISILSSLISETQNPRIKILIEHHIKNLKMQEVVMSQLLQINSFVPHVCFLTIRKYLQFCDGNSEHALNMILNNIPIDFPHDETTQVEMKLRDTELDYLRSKIRLESFRANSIQISRCIDEEEEEGEERAENGFLEVEKEFIETTLREENRKRKGTKFFCKGEQKVIQGNKPKVYTIHKTNEYYASGEDLHFRMVESQYRRWFQRYLELYNNMYRNSQVGCFNIQKIEYCVNPGIMKQFEKCKKDLAKRHNFLESSMKPILLFHGTSPQSMSAILRTNFLRSKIGSHTGNRGAYGEGFYFSEYPQYCMGYSRGSNQLLVCLGLTGKAHKMPCQTGAPKVEGYDSHVSVNGFEVVIYEPEQVRPLYIIYLTPAVNK